MIACQPEKHFQKLSYILFGYLHSFYCCTRIVALGTTNAQRACNAVRVINRLPYNDDITNLVNVNWAVTVIDQRRLPLELLTTPHITPPAHYHGREPPRRMDTKVSNSKSDLHGH